jgi:hypothetical protein
MPHRECQSHVERIYGPAKLVAVVRESAKAGPVFVFEITLSRRRRRVHAWREMGRITVVINARDRSGRRPSAATKSPAQRTCGLPKRTDRR